MESDSGGTRTRADLGEQRPVAVIVGCKVMDLAPVVVVHAECRTGKLAWCFVCWGEGERRTRDQRV